MPPPSPEWARQTPDGVLIAVHIQPNASRSACAGQHGEALKLRIAAPPVEGAANEALTHFLADRLRVPLRNITIQSGERSRRKQVLLRNTTLETVTERLGL